MPDRDDPANWDKLKRFFADIFRTRTRAEWTELFDGTDACVTPVLSFKEAMQHPHNVARKTFVEGSGVMQPAPAPRFSHTPGAITQAPPIPGEHSRDILHAWGIDAATAEQLIDDGVVIQN
ncbi:CoA transferase [Aeromicrobium sp. UC242_57]|uniref:CoA transferase n=1 Tax=Aeromicrobium sp. UC242_57 TaxID=3374624 RepID=UPI0037B6F9BF